jgi:hypothetical protein
MFTPEMKRATMTVVKDTESKMSYRVMSFFYYLAIRACDVIDWWFPTEYEKRIQKAAAISKSQSTATRGQR